MNRRKFIFSTVISAGLLSMSAIPAFPDVPPIQGGKKKKMSSKEKARAARCKGNKTKLSRCNRELRTLERKLTQTQNKLASAKANYKHKEKVSDFFLEQVIRFKREMKMAKSALKTASGEELSALNKDFRNAERELKRNSRELQKSVKQQDKLGRTVDKLTATMKDLQLQIRAKKREIRKLAAAMKKDKCK